MSTLVTSANNGGSPFSGTWETNLVGYTASDAPSAPGGSCVPPTIFGDEIVSVGFSTQTPGQSFGSYNMLVMRGGVPQNFFDRVTITKAGGTPHVYTSAAATYYPNVADNGQVPGSGAWTAWIWPVGSNIDFAAGIVTTLDWVAPVPTPGGKGDIMNPLAWETVSTGKLPPTEYDGIPGGGFV